MYNIEFKNTIEIARKLKGLSQRELAKKSGLSHSTYNDIINGRIKKIDIEKIKRISDGLDLPFVKLLRLTHYKIVLDYLGV